jgi:hypothetical protein
VKTVAAKPTHKRLWRRLFVFGALLGAYPAFVMGATYMQFFAADLPGGRNGPADAYRHSLASAIVAYTLSPRCVDWVTAVMERAGKVTSPVQWMRTTTGSARASARPPAAGMQCSMLYLLP